MIAPNEVLRFSLGELYHGLAECNGLLRVDDNAVFMEYVVKDSLLGVIKSNVKTIKLRYDRLLDAQFVNKFFKKQIILKPMSMLDFADIPSADTGEIVLKIAKDKQTLFVAETITTFISLKISEVRISKLS